MTHNRISDIVEGHILELLQQGYSQSPVVHIVKFNGINISQPTSKERLAFNEILKQK